MDRPRLQPPLGLVVFVVGTCILGAEIAAARLLAPSFGASTFVWANTIGVVLVALAVGYWWGGRMADRNPTAEGLFRIVLVAGVLIGVVPFVADPFLDLAVDALDSISAGAFVGSLVAVLVLIAVPVLVSGLVAPYALRLAIEGVEEAGTVSGRLYAISTVGSLLGTFLSALLLIPLLGTRRTFLVFALALAVVGVAGLARRRFLLVPVVLAALIVVPVGTVKGDVPDGARVIHEADTEYQYARVVEYPSGLRELELNEGQAVHSVWRPDAHLTDDYWDDCLVLPFAVLDGPPERVAILGNAAGTVARNYGHFFPSTAVDAVEIDPELTEIGRRYFDMRGPRLRVFDEDARPYLRRTGERYDLIVVDAYRQPYIPFYLATEEFFELVRDRLTPDGLVVINVGHPKDNDDLEKVLGRTMAEVFPTVLRTAAERTNTMMIGTAGEGAGGARLRQAVASLPAALRPRATEASARIEPRLEGGSVYTDDRAPVEWLIDASIVDVAANGE